MGNCLRVVLLAQVALEIPGPMNHGFIQVVQNPSSQLSVSLQSNIQSQIVTSLKQVPKAFIIHVSSAACSLLDGPEYSLWPLQCLLSDARGSA